jgi:hypothetical protein
MTPTAIWATVLVASAITFGWKLLGHTLPARWFESPRLAPVVGLITASLLAGLVVVQTVATTLDSGAQGIRVDARLVAAGLAALLFWRKVPFVLVVIIAAAAAAGLRALGWG